MKRIADVLAQLVGPEGRQAATVQLAGSLGALHAMIFIPDPEVDLHMPAPGFPQTLKSGAEWQAFVHRSVSDGRHQAALPYTDGICHPAWGFAAADCSVLVLLGGQPDMAATEDALSMLPLVAAAFRGEAGARSGEVRTDNAMKIAEQTATLAKQLERTRRELLEALMQREAAVRHSEEQKGVLQALMEGAPLAAILETLAAFAQRYATGSQCGILLLDQNGTKLHWAAAANLPEAFCREATFLDAYEQQFHGQVVRSGQRGITAEIARDPLWARAKALTERFGLVSCCSTPIIASTGAVLGMFDLYYDHPHLPEPAELRLVDLAVQLAAVSIERRCAEEDRTHKVRQLIRNMTEGVVAADTRGRVLILNPAAAADLALTATAENQGIDELGLPPVLLAAFRQVLKAESADIVNLVLPSGDKFLDVTVSAAITPEGRPNGAVALLRDITDEMRFRRLQESFVANVSHELRGPLAALSAVIEGFRDGMIPEVARPRYLDGIHAEIGRLSRLVNDLLYLSRLDAGTARLKTVALDLRVLWQSVAELYAPRCEAKGLTLLIDAPHITVRADHDAVKQVILAFLENAVTHTPPGGTIRLFAAIDGRRVRVGVADNGSGIPAEHLSYIWERFYKVDQARTRGAETGVGLGLSIAREIVRRMGGDVFVDSEAGRGSVFGCLLPLRDGEAD